jgi:hypothetical protein
VPAKVNPMRVEANADAAEPTVRVRGLELSTTKSAATPVTALKAPPVSSTAAAPMMAPHPPASVVVTPTSSDPVSHIVSSLVNAVLSPFANSAPTTPVRPPAELALLAFARREGEPGFFSPSAPANPPARQDTNALITDTATSTSAVTTSAVEPDFVSSTRSLFGLFSLTSAGDPDDNYVAVVISTPLFTDILTSGHDPEDNLGFGAASIGVAGHTVNTFTSPFLDFSIAIPIEDPFTDLFIALIRAGLV